MKKIKKHVPVTNETGTHSSSEGFIELKDYLFYVSCRGLECMSIQQSKEDNTYKRHSNAQMRVRHRAINDI